MSERVERFTLIGARSLARGRGEENERGEIMRRMLRNHVLRCPRCGQRWFTIRRAGEAHTCKDCSHRFTVAGAAADLRSAA